MLYDFLNGIANRKHYYHSRLEHRHGRYQDDRYGPYNPLLELAQKLLRNKALLAGIALTLLVIGALGIWLLVTLLLYFVPAFSTVGTVLEQQGIKGILAMITPFLQRIWEGAGK